MRPFPTAVLALALTIGLTAFTVSLDPPVSPASANIEVASSYTIDKAHSAVSFRIRHLGISNVTGTFSEYDADVSMVGDDLSTLTASATINVATIDTRNERRDNHLRSDDFFEVERYPTMTFVSSGIHNVQGDSFQIEGDLTIRDVTRPVVLDAQKVGSATGPDGSYRIGIEASTTIDRHDYGLTWNRLSEAGGVVVGRDVRITLDIQTIRQD